MRRYSIPLSLGAIVAAMTATGYAAGIFTDVPEHHWAYPFVIWAYDNHIMTGPGGQTRKFEPNRPATRAEVAAVAARLYENLHGELEILERQIRFGQSSSRRASSRSSIRSSARSSSRSSLSPVRRSSSSSSRSSARATFNDFEADLRGSEEVPPVTTSMRGRGTFALRDDGLHYDITVEGNTSGTDGTITAAHFHRGARRQAGLVLEPIPFNGNRAVGLWSDISDNAIDALLNGQIYVNVHTRANPNGEIRGQVTRQ
ncbi:CHRD domain-containing protein [Candidatus Peregrinibacteria bacterium]|nr:CHRD domain-containing protein [Candidatus Peregrinibacteria bacterium]